MAIKNYTTTIEVYKSISEIQQFLVAQGAEKIMIDYDGGQPVRLVFRLESAGYELDFSLPCNWVGVRECLEQANIPKKHKTDSQALRTAWRILRDWVHAQMAIVESQMITAGEVYTPYIVMKSGLTLREEIAKGKYLLDQ